MKEAPVCMWHSDSVSADVILARPKNDRMLSRVEFGLEHFMLAGFISNSMLDEPWCCLLVACWASEHNGC